MIRRTRAIDVHFIHEGGPVLGGPGVIVATAGGSVAVEQVPSSASENETVSAGERAVGLALDVEAVVLNPRRADSWETSVAPSTPLSIVVSTMARPVRLRRCLSSLEPHLREGDEIVVVDNSSDGSGRVIAAAAAVSFCHEPRLGVSFARNTGADCAVNDIVVFLDDDVVVDPYFLNALRLAFIDQRVDAVTCAVLARRPELYHALLFDERYPFFRGWTPRRFANGTGTRRSPFDTWRVGTGAAMAWRRPCFLGLGGCDPALGQGTPAGGVEDLDLFRRALESGRTLLYTPAGVVWHDHPETRADLRRKMLHYAVTDGAHAAKVLLESGRFGAARMVVRQWLRVPRRAMVEGGRRVAGQTSLPLLGVLGDPLANLVGAVRFIRHRRTLRALDPSWAIMSSPRGRRRQPGR